MTVTTRARLALAVAGLYASVGVFELMSDHNPEEDTLLLETVDYALEWLFAAAVAATAVALVTFALQISHRWGQVGAAAAAAGHGLLAVAAATTAASGRESLDALFGIGVLLLLVGYVTLTVLDVRRQIEPSRAAVALLVGYVAAIITDGMGIGGGFMLAASWAAIAHLWTRAARSSGRTDVTVSS